MKPQPEDILADATEGGSRAVNQAKPIGSLEVGKKADLFVIDTLKPYLVPAGRLVSAVIHGGHPSDIESVMVDGQFVMRNDKVLTMDEAGDHQGSRCGGQTHLAEGRASECAAIAAPAGVASGFSRIVDRRAVMTRWVLGGVVIAIAGAALSAQQPPARPMSPEGSAQVQVLGSWTKPARPAFTLGRETYEGGRWIEIRYGRPLQRGRDLFGSGPNYGKAANDVGAPGFPRRRCGARAPTSRRA